MQREKACLRFDAATQHSNPGSLSRESEVPATAPLRHNATAPLRHCATAPQRHCATALPRNVYSHGLLRPRTNYATSKLLAVYVYTPRAEFKQ